MNVLIVYVYFEFKLFNGVFKDFVVWCLEVVGYIVQVLDLYVMQWKVVFDVSDSIVVLVGLYFYLLLDFRYVFENGL